MQNVIIYLNFEVKFIRQKVVTFRCKVVRLDLNKFGLKKGRLKGKIINENL